ALLGPSGSGKSTLLRVIAGLEDPDSGTVCISGTNATTLPAQKRDVGFVFQHYAAFKHLNVHQNVAFGLKIRKRPKAEIERRVDELLELVHLGGLAHRYPTQLSGGQRQRMALARALAVEPKVLPRGVAVMLEPNGTTDEAMIDRVVHLGFEVLVAFTLNDGRQAWAQLTREEADALELEQGQIVYVRTDRSRAFTG